MSPTASVVIDSFATSGLDALKSVDRQTLPASDLEVLLVDDGTDPAARSRLEQLVANRPHFRLIEATAGSPPGARRDAATRAATGRYLLFLDDGVVLADQALERLCAFADEHAADVCLGKTGRRGGRPPGADLFTENRPRAAKDAVLDQALGSPVLYRRAFLVENRLEHPEPTGPDAATALARKAATRTDRISVVADHAVFADARRPKAATTPAAPGRPKARHVGTTWVDGALRVTLQLAHRAGADGVLDGVEVLAGVVRPSDGTEWLAPPADVELDRGAGLRVTATVRPQVLAGGARLANGTWRPVLVLRGAGWSQRLRVPAPEGLVRCAMCGDVVVVCHEDGGQLALDVGAVRRAVVPGVDAASATVVESARGSLLRAPVRDLDLPPGAEVHGLLRIGGLPVRAVLRADGGGATLSAWVSGLPGSYPLATRFSPAPYAATGASLEVAGDGTMTIRQVAPATTTVPAPAVERRRPAGWKRAAKRVPGSRAFYRRLVGSAHR
jgi:hypothetical protein